MFSITFINPFKRGLSRFLSDFRFDFFSIDVKKNHHFSFIVCNLKITYYEG
jgi:hypothetical protein